MHTNYKIIINNKLIETHLTSGEKNNWNGREKYDGCCYTLLQLKKWMILCFQDVHSPLLKKFWQCNHVYAWIKQTLLGNFSKLLWFCVSLH